MQLLTVNQFELISGGTKGKKKASLSNKPKSDTGTSKASSSTRTCGYFNLAIGVGAVAAGLYVADEYFGYPVDETAYALTDSLIDGFSSVKLAVFG